MADLSGVRVVIERPCEACGATGEIENEAETARVAELGVDVPVVRPCGNCEGSGQATDTIALDELLDWLVERVPVALIPRPELEAVVATLQRTVTDAADSAHARSDPDAVALWLRAVQEGAEALRSITELLVRDRHA